MAQRAADMARRSFLRVVGVIENMSAFTCEHGEPTPLFGAGGGAGPRRRRSASPLLGRIPLEPAVSAGGDAGTPVTLEPGASPAAAAFARIATALDAVAPHQLAEPDDMSGCSARLLAAVGAALEADTRRGRPGSEPPPPPSGHSASSIGRSGHPLLDIGLSCCIRGS